MSSVSLDGVTKRAGDYAQDQLEAAVDKPGITGDAVDSYRKYAAGKRCMVFCVTIKHSEHVCAQYNALAYRQNTSMARIQTASVMRFCPGFRAGITKVVCSCNWQSKG